MIRRFIISIADAIVVGTFVLIVVVSTVVGYKMAEEQALFPTVVPTLGHGWELRSSTPFYGGLLGFLAGLVVGALVCGLYAVIFEASQNLRAIRLALENADVGQLLSERASRARHGDRREPLAGPASSLLAGMRDEERGR